MSSKFGKQYPVLGTRTIISKSSEREKLVFIAAAGLLFSLLVILFAVFSFREDAGANQTGSNASPIPATVGTVTLLTPDRMVKASDPLSEVVFKEMYWPRNQVPEGAIRDVAELRGLYARVNLEPGSPVLRSQLSREPTARITLPLTPGNRAVSINVDETSGIEGHALPGTRVDVVLTYYEQGQLTTKVIVQNARVLSFGGDTTTVQQRQNLPGATRVQKSTVTLDVVPKDALAIRTAQQLGKLALIMRAPEDDKTAVADQFAQGDFSDQKNKGQSQKQRACTRGKMRIDGKEYVVECDGSISQVLNSDEP